MIKAICTWGDGPDVIVNLDGTKLILYEKPFYGKWEHGVVSEGSLDLTATEAEIFGQQLLDVAKQARDLCREYSESQRGLE